MITGKVILTEHFQYLQNGVREWAKQNSLKMKTELTKSKLNQKIKKILI